MDEWVDKCESVWMDRWMDSWLYVQMYVCMYGWINKQTNVKIDGWWTDAGWLAGWMERAQIISIEGKVYQHSIEKSKSINKEIDQ